MNTSNQAESPAYLNPDLPIETRVNDLIARMTTDEKISQMTSATTGIPRLGIPAYNYWNEALHGVARAGRATVFPQAIGMAATWDVALIRRIASAIGDEARAKHHEAMRRFGNSTISRGLTFWSPNINIFRDPRWGRGQETWGEDPCLTGETGAAFVRGLQGDHPRYLRASACAKHYAVHSGPEKDRHVFDAKVSQHDLVDTYLPAFKKLVTEAKVEAVMGAYNRVNGEPACASQALLVDVLRGQWGFKGHVVSDCGALSDIHTGHKLTRDAAESAALALKAGCDIACGATYDKLGDALARGLIEEADIDRALARTLATRFKLGMFDPPELVPYASIPMSVVNSPEHRALALQAAGESIVLLKNKDNILPIGDKTGSIVVTGPTAANTEVLLGNYYGLSDHLTTIVEGIVGRVPESMAIEYRPGCTLDAPNRNDMDWTYDIVGGADITIACVGLSPFLESEEGDAILSVENGDRSQLGLPATQVAFVKRLVKSGAKVVLVVTGGSPVDLSELAELAQAVLFVWYPGQEGGDAVADVLFGQRAPSGKLPLTFPKSAEQLPPFDDYSMAGRTYRYATAEPLYPFGFGLSTTTFSYSNLTLDKDSLQAGEGLTCRFTLTNMGAIAADEVAQCYITCPNVSGLAPLHSLASFQRVRLQPGESRMVKFALTPVMLSVVDGNGRLKQEPGEYRVSIGGCSPGARGLALGAPQPVTATFRV
ncbi:MAG: glycoside hydrolase family 3 C-terminal domain-containing protein [Chloroflexi bacterium]|nr:glycoside hydrolase family 3 C-terminal domain-containing protein [Chloroflexota bacterium]MCL5275056.1 glycoside hydrolase family 3 C-terminal domain-containing protein [Chloroflexota bacterium]